jgi:hypothetical protein
MAERYSKFHIKVKKGRGLRRTTVSIEGVVADLFALRLGHSLGTVEAHTAVREWLQDRQDEQNMSYADSGLLKQQMIMEVADRGLVRKYYAE